MSVSAFLFVVQAAKDVHANLILFHASSVGAELLGGGVAGQPDFLLRWALRVLSNTSSVSALGWGVVRAPIFFVFTKLRRSDAASSEGAFVWSLNWASDLLAFVLADSAFASIAFLEWWWAFIVGLAVAAVWVALGIWASDWLIR